MLDEDIEKIAEAVARRLNFQFMPVPMASQGQVDPAKQIEIERMVRATPAQRRELSRQALVQAKSRVTRR